jgi:transposase
MYQVTKLVPEHQFTRLLQLLPTPQQKRMGRPRVSKKALVNGILQVLINGVAWNKIADCGCSYVSCYRYFKELQRRGIIKKVFQTLSSEKTDLTVGSIDTTTAPSFEFTHGTGYNGKEHTVGTKISLYVDQYGRPADALFAKGNINDRHFLFPHLENTKGKYKKVLNLDMMYMGLNTRRGAREKGIRVNMEVREQDYKRKRGPKFYFDEALYKTRFYVERTNGWIKNFKRLRLRQEYHVAMFKAMVYLALIIILIRY